MDNLSMNMKKISFSSSDEGMFQCISEGSSGTKFNIDHHWHPKKFLNKILYYRCLHCGKRISKGEYNRRMKSVDIYFS
jgi:hypothetical protein